MSRERTRRLCLVSRVPGIAGPATFQRRLADGLGPRGIDVCYSLEDIPYDAVLVTGGTRRLGGLWRARMRGVPILQRLDGMNWIHRRRWTGAQHFLRAEANNLLLRIVRRHYANAIVYQSRFVQRWWDASQGPAHVPTSVVHNGVPLEMFRPGPPALTRLRRRLLVVEASLSGGYESGLEHAVSLLNALPEEAGEVELAVAGQVAIGLRRESEARAQRPIAWLGEVAQADLPELYRTAAMVFSADVNPACPNTVIESLACGTPVVAFDTGALPEMIEGDAGRLVPFGADAWKLESPDIPALAAAAWAVMGDLPRYRRGARVRAEAAFGLDQMVDGYLAALGWAA